MFTGAHSPVNFPLVSMDTPPRPEPRNVNSQRDMWYMTNLNTWILGPLGVWPISETARATFLSGVAVLLGIAILFFAIVPCTLYTVYEEKDTTVRLKLLGFLIFCLVSALKYCVLVVRKSDIRKCIEHMRHDWTLVELCQDREMMLKQGKAGRNLTLLCACFMYAGGLIYHTILPFAAGRNLDPYNNTIRPLVYPTYRPLFDAQISPVYEFVFLAHFLCGYVMYSVTAGACGLAALFATHACGQIDIVNSRLEDLVDGSITGGKSTPCERLAVAVNYYLRVLRFAATVEQMFQEVCLLECVGSLAWICLVEYYCIMDWKERNVVSLATYIGLLISLTFNIFILCYIGELLMEKTANVGMRCFSIDWYRLPAKTARNLILVIIISASPIKISAGRMVELSLFTFMNLLKTTLAYLSFLRTAVM